MEFMVGADPEVFLTDEDGNFRSAIDVISGTKYKQLMVKGGGLQHDNVAAEFSCDPSPDENSFVESIRLMLSQLASHVKPLSLRVQASTNFPEQQLQSMEARTFGCDPDYDCWEIRENTIDPLASFSTFRSCGGHVHVGTKNGLPKILCGDDADMGRIKLVRAMDFYLGIPSVLLDKDPSSPPRRKLYGKAGAHRPKSYGVEYRALSNFWIASPVLTRLVYRLTALSVGAADLTQAEKDISSLGLENIPRIINSANVKEARDVFEKYIKRFLKKETLELFETAASANGYDPYKEWNL